MADSDEGTATALFENKGTISLAESAKAVSADSAGADSAVANVMVVDGILQTLDAPLGKGKASFVNASNGKIAFNVVAAATAEDSAVAIAITGGVRQENTNVPSGVFLVDNSGSLTVTALATAKSDTTGTAVADAWGYKATGFAPTVVDFSNAGKILVTATAEGKTTASSGADGVVFTPMGSLDGTAKNTGQIIAVASASDTGPALSASAWAIAVRVAADETHFTLDNVGLIQADALTGGGDTSTASAIVLERGYDGDG